MDNGQNNRVTRWTQKLLDLSLRNRLLNARDSKQIIPLVCDNVEELEDRLAADQTIPVECVDANARTTGSLRTSISDEEMRRRLKELFRLAKTDLEEAGINTLFLAIGFLKWRPQGANAKDYRAPILLMPVSLSRKNVREGYAVTRLDEDTLLNATLLEFLRAEFGIQVEHVDPLPEDNSGVAVGEVFQSFREAVRSMEGWAVEPDAALGHFSFGKFVMWKDLSSRAEQLAQHPFVSHLMKGGGNYDDGVEVFPPEEVESKIEYGKLYCPLSADSSQLTAVLYSAMGKSFVLHGPPGTGKSQTIANLIAHNLARGRKVLFVSEKKAALDVVHRRLSNIGLKPFCLELHSTKAGKTEVLAQFKEALDYVDKGEPNEWQKTVDTISNYRSELDAVVAALHKRQKNGLSAYDCFARKIAGGAKIVEIVDEKVCEWSEKDVATARENVQQMAADWRGTTPEAVMALLPVVADFDWNPTAERDVNEALGALSDAIRKNGYAYVPWLFSSRPSLTLNAAEASWFDRVVNAIVWCRTKKTPTALKVEEIREAAAVAEKNARRPGFLRGIFSFLSGFDRVKVDASFADSIDKARQYMNESRGVMRYRKSEQAASLMVGDGFSEALEHGELDPASIDESFDRSFAEATLNEILRLESALASFEGMKREDAVLKFRQLDDEYAELARHVVRARLAAAMPGGRLGDCPDGCELGIIRRECAKKARQKPVRQLLAETRGVVGSLKPCFLMSPLSVSQYLPPEATFDMVVFDEASQIPVWDAIGVIARAKQCVVVGDPKQMPPTNFFQKSEAGEEDDSDEDLESILDECLAAGLYSAYLNWHYRSRHESLIAFSNHNYYDDRLFTFPAAKSPPRLGVKHVFVENGVYDAKASRTNRAEAQALVDYVFERLADPTWKRRSAGVVAFSMAQKNLIEDLFEEKRAENPKFEDYFTDDCEEPFFVKNLENVQGDERDVILFSVGYAKGPDGKFLMNFGPLNRSGGERRLNVAVTRAKEQVVVFASCKGAEIDLNRTQATGAAHLKAFLEYAERGGTAVADDSAEKSRDIFAGEVVRFLTASGYTADRQVGCSGYRIDIGVRDPDAKGAYLAAVECDGEPYADAYTARDRDKQRSIVLKSLGWNTVRVWAADWYFDRKRAEERLLAALDEIKRAPNRFIPDPKFEPSVTFPRKRASAAQAEVKRTSLEEVSPDAIRKTMDEVERDLGRCERDTLYREVAKRYGYKTLSPKARERLDSIARR